MCRREVAESGQGMLVLPHKGRVVVPQPASRAPTDVATVGARVTPVPQTRKSEITCKKLLVQGLEPPLEQGIKLEIAEFINSWLDRTAVALRERLVGTRCHSDAARAAWLCSGGPTPGGTGWNLAAGISITLPHGCASLSGSVVGFGHTCL